MNNIIVINAQVIHKYLAIMSNGVVKPMTSLYTSDGRIVLTSCWRCSQIEVGYYYDFSVRSITKCSYKDVWYARKLELIN